MTKRYDEVQKKNDELDELRAQNVKFLTLLDRISSFLGQSAKLKDK